MPGPCCLAATMATLVRGALATALMQLLFCQAAAIPTPCSETGALVAMSRARACFRAIPFNDSWQATTVGFLQASLERYSFLDLFVASALPYRYRHDAAAKLAAAASASFLGDYDFQVSGPWRLRRARKTRKPACDTNQSFAVHPKTLARVHRKPWRRQSEHSKTGTLSTSSPSAMLASLSCHLPQWWRSVSHAWPGASIGARLAALAGHCHPTLAVHPPNLADETTGELHASVQALSLAGTSVTSVLSPELSSRIGWQVSTIDGVEAVSAMHDFTERFSVYSNDAAARFTGAVRELAFSARSMQLLPLPERDNSTLVLINPDSGAFEQVVVPWMASLATPFGDLDSVVQRCLRTTAGPRGSSGACPEASVSDSGEAWEARLRGAAAGDALSPAAKGHLARLRAAFGGASSAASMRAAATVAESPLDTAARQHWSSALDAWSRGRLLGARGNARHLSLGTLSHDGGARTASAGHLSLRLLERALPPYVVESLVSAGIAPFTAVSAAARLRHHDIGASPAERRQILSAGPVMDEMGQTAAAAELAWQARSLAAVPSTPRQQVVRIHDSTSEDGVAVSIIQRANAAPVVLLRMGTFNPPYIAQCFEALGDSLCASTAALVQAEQCFAAGLELFLARTVTVPAEAALAYNAPQLILDLSGNRGGNVLLGQLFAAYNFAALQKQPLAAGATMRFRISPILATMAEFVERKAAEAGATSLQSVLPGFPLLGVQVLQPQAGQSAEDATEMTASASLPSFEWYTSGSTAQFGAGRVRVSDAFRLVNLATAVDSSSQLARGVVWNETNAVIISDLLCGSMCAQVVHTLKEHGQARVVGVGGLGDDQGDTTAFAGGFIVSDAETVVAQGRALAALGYTGPIAPLPDTSATFSFNEAMAFSHSRRLTPMQFAPVTADARILDWSSDGASLDEQLQAATRALDGDPSALAGLSTHDVLLYALSAACLVMLVTLVLCGAHIRTSGRVWARCPVCLGVCFSGNHRKVSASAHGAAAEQIDLDRVLARDRRAAQRRRRSKLDDSLRGVGKHHGRHMRGGSRRRSRSSGPPGDADRASAHNGLPAAMHGGQVRKSSQPYLADPSFALASSAEPGVAYSTPDPDAAEALPAPPVLALDVDVRSARGSEARSDSKQTPARAHQAPTPSRTTLVEEMLATSSGAAPR